MGKKKKLGSTVPVKFSLFSDGIQITSQEELDAALWAIESDPACPAIIIYDVTDEAEALEVAE